MENLLKIISPPHFHCIFSILHIFTTENWKTLLCENTLQGTFQDTVRIHKRERIFEMQIFLKVFNSLVSLSPLISYSPVNLKISILSFFCLNYVWKDFPFNHFSLLGENLLFHIADFGGSFGPERSIGGWMCVVWENISIKNESFRAFWIFINDFLS